MFICPVCGYDRMLRPPAVGYICPCCGVEFELDDNELSHDDLRRAWMARGMRWFSRAAPAPQGWNPLAQLVRAGYIHEVYRFTSGHTHSMRSGAALQSLQSSSRSRNQLSRASSAGTRVMGLRPEPNFYA
jgi:hypothetical protein